MVNRWRSESEEALEGCLDAIADAERTLTVALAAADLVDAVELAERVEQLARLVYRLQVRAAGAVEAESPAVRRSAPPPGAPFRRGCDLLRTRLRISGREASRRIRAAGAVLPGTVLSGGAVEPPAPVLAAGLGIVQGLSAAESAEALRWDDDGATAGDPGSSPHLTRAPGAEALDVVVRTLAQVRSVAEPTVVADAEKTLVSYAATFDPDTMRRVGQRLLSLLDPDGVEPSDRDLARRQGVRVGATWRGLTHLDIWADAVQTEVLMTVFDTGSNPRGTPHGTEPGADASQRAAAAAPAGTSAVPHPTVASDGVVEDRSRPQRMLDSLVSACQAALRTARLPAVAGLPPQLIVTMNLGDLRERAPATSGRLAEDPVPRVDPGRPPPDRTGWGRTPHAGPVPVTLLRRLACDADIIPVVLGGASEVMDVGRARRLVPAAMRRVLIARDGGCIFPGCTIPATWTEAHHVVPWSHGGATSLANTTLLCPAHHHAVHSGRWVAEEAASSVAGDAGERSIGGRGRPFRVTPPWAARREQTWNAYPLGA